MSAPSPRAISPHLAHRVRNRLAVVRAGLELLQAGREADLSPEFRAVLVREIEAVVRDWERICARRRPGRG